MNQHLQTWSIHGLGRLIERKAGAWFYKRRTSQHWSPMMHEVSTEYGVRIGGWRIGVTQTYKVFRDGKEPRIVPGPY